MPSPPLDSNAEKQGESMGIILQFLHSLYSSRSHNVLVDATLRLVIDSGLRFTVITRSMYT